MRLVCVIWRQFYFFIILIVFSSTFHTLIYIYISYNIVEFFSHEGGSDLKKSEHKLRNIVVVVIVVEVLMKKR